MTSALYLEHYLDGLESLPTELKRNFTLMRELDTRAQNLMKQIDEEASDLMKNNISAKENFSEEEKKSKLKHIQELFGRAKEYGDDKVQLAIQTYELVDKHIRRLDSDLARFEGEIQDKTNTTRDKSEDGNVGKKGRKKTKDAKVAGKKKRSLSDEEEKVEEKTTSTTTHKSNKKQKVTQEKEGRKAQKQKNVELEEVPAEGHFTPHPSDVLDMPVDPNEPTYCLCHQVSYGEMIGCDNSDCPIEWFHFACVGLTTKPKGKWYCPKCQINRKKK